MDTIIAVIAGVAGIAIGAGVCYALLKKGVDAEKESMLKQAREEGEQIKKEKLIQAKEKFVQLKAEHEKAILQKDKKISEAESRVKQKENSLNQKLAEANKKDQRVEATRIAHQQELGVASAAAVAAHGDGAQ